MTTEKTSSTSKNKKPLPKGLEQVTLQEYRDQHKKAIEIRKKKIQSSKAISKVVQTVLILLAIPFIGILIYWGICMFSPAPTKP